MARRRHWILEPVGVLRGERKLPSDKCPADSLLLVGRHQMLPFQRQKCGLVPSVGVIHLAARLIPVRAGQKLVYALEAPVAQPSSIEVEELVDRPGEN